MRTSTLLSIHGYCFFAVFILLGLTALETMDQSFLFIAYLVLAVASVFGLLASYFDHKGD